MFVVGAVVAVIIIVLTLSNPLNGFRVAATYLTREPNMSDEAKPSGYVHVDFSRVSTFTDFQDGNGPCLEIVIFFSGYWVGQEAPCQYHLDFLSNHVDELKMIVDTTGTIRVEGFASNTGSSNFNQGLSQHRADLVKKWLTEIYGIDAAKVVEDRGLGAMKADQRKSMNLVV